MTMSLTHRTRVDRRPAAGIDAHPRAFPTATVEAARRQPARRRHAAHMGIGSHTGAAITATSAQRLAFVSAAGVVEGLERLVEAALIIAAVEHHAHAAVRPIRKIGALNEILSSHVDLVEVEMTRNRIDGTFRNVGALGTSVTAIGVDWNGI